MWGPTARVGSFGAGVMVRTRSVFPPLAVQLAQQLPPDLQGREIEELQSRGRQEALEWLIRETQPHSKQP